MVTGIQQIYDQRARLVQQMQEIPANAAKEARAMTQEETEKWGKIEADERALTATIEAHEKTEKLVAERAGKAFEATATQAPTWTSDNTASRDSGKDKAYRSAYENYLRHGVSNLSAEEKRLMSEKRGTSTQVVGTDNLGGYLVPDEWQPEIERSMKDFSGILQAARIIRTTTGRTLYWPTYDDTSTLSVKTAEAATITTQDLTVGVKQLDAYKYGSRMLVSSELLQDNAYRIETEMPMVFGERHGRTANNVLTLGDGSGDPNGVVTATSAGKTAQSATAITFLEVLDLKHSIDPAYRRSASFGFMFNDVVLLYLKKLVDSENRPLWTPSYREGQPDTIDGTRYWINQDMDSSINASSKLILCGDFSRYIVRMVNDMSIVRLNELYAADDLVGFHSWMRLDGELLNTGAIKHLITAAS